MLTLSVSSPSSCQSRRCLQSSSSSLESSSSSHSSSPSSHSQTPEGREGALWLLPEEESLDPEEELPEPLDELEDEPVERGFEREIKKRLDYWARLRDQKRQG